MIDELSNILHKNAKGLIFHLQVKNFAAFKELLTVIDLVAIVLLLCPGLEDVAEDVQVAARVCEGVVISATA